VDAIADLEIDVAGRALGINALVGVELGGNGGEDALPAGIAHGDSRMKGNEVRKNGACLHRRKSRMALIY
jgi:hypothetical protein